MSTSNGTSRKHLDLDGLISAMVSEAEGIFTAGRNEDRGWRRTGSRRANERKLSDLEAARNDTRRLLEGSEFDDGNEFAIGAAENRVNYVIGDGFKYEAIPNPAFPEDPAAVKDVADFLEVFSELNDLPSIESEALWRGDRDGDAILRLFPADGIPEARWVEPERMRPPTSMDGDRWGIQCVPGDYTKRLGYWIEPDLDNEPEFVPEAEILHLAFNSTSACLRGWPTFEPVARALRRAEELLVAGTASCRSQAKIAVVEKIAGFSKEKADALVSRLTERKQSQPDGSRPETVLAEEIPYGAKIRIPAGNDVVFPGAAGSQPVIDMIQANLRAAGSRLTMPEWMFSGLADAKYSNAFVVEAPTLKSFRRLQRMLRIAFGEGRFRQQASLIWRAMRMAVQANILDARVLRLVQIKATGPSLEMRDKAAEASQNATYLNAGVKSRQTIQTELSLDPKEESAKVDAEIKKYGLPGRWSPPQGGYLEPGGQAGQQNGVGGAGLGFGPGDGQFEPGTPQATPPVAASVPVSEALLHAVLPAGVVLEDVLWAFADDVAVAGWTAEAGGLVPKKITVTTKKGTTYEKVVMVRPEGNKAPNAKVPGPVQTTEDHIKTVADAFNNPGSVSLSAVAKSLGHLTTSQLQTIQAQIGVKGGKLKPHVKDTILAKLKERVASIRAAGTISPESTIPLEDLLPEASKPTYASRPTSKRDYASPTEKPITNNLDGVSLVGSAKSAAHTLFGRNPNGKILAAAVNSSQGSTSRVVNAYDADQHSTLRINTTGEGYDVVRTFHFDDEGKLVCHNDHFFVDYVRDPASNGPPPGWRKLIKVDGADLMANQVRALRDLGVDRIETHAARADSDDPNNAMVGYYVWPKMGYDASIPDSVWSRMPEKFKAVVRANPTGSKVPHSILDLYTNEEAVKWWKKNGRDLPDAVFDLRDGSLSMRTLENYLKNKFSK